MCGEGRVLLLRERVCCPRFAPGRQAISPLSLKARCPPSHWEWRAIPSPLGPWDLRSRDKHRPSVPGKKTLSSGEGAPSPPPSMGEAASPLSPQEACCPPSFIGRRVHPKNHPRNYGHFAKSNLPSTEQMGQLSYYKLFSKNSVMSIPNNACFWGPLVTEHRDILLTILLLVIITMPDIPYC